jgi:hypothetical protein
MDWTSMDMGAMDDLPGWDGRHRWSSGSDTFCFDSIYLPFAESLGLAPLSFYV